MNPSSPKVENTEPDNDYHADEPLIRPAPPTTPADDNGGPVRATVDGHCGSGHKNTICSGWHTGDCCSAFGVSELNCRPGHVTTNLHLVLWKHNLSLRLRLSIWSMSWGESSHASSAAALSSQAPSWNLSNCRPIGCASNDCSPAAEWSSCLCR